MIAQVQCLACGGGGVLGVVTREMAGDAGEPDREGEVIRCDTCGGQGWIAEEVDDE